MKNNQYNFTLKETRKNKEQIKPKVNKGKKIIKIIAEKKQNRKQTPIEKINETNSWFFE